MKIKIDKKEYKREVELYIEQFKQGANQAITNLIDGKELIDIRDRELDCWEEGYEFIKKCYDFDLCQLAVE